MTENTRRKNCKFRKAKGRLRKWLSDNKGHTKTIILIVIVVWLAITFLMWGFTQKTVTETVCVNVTDELRSKWWDYGEDYCLAGGWYIYAPPCKTYESCDDIPHQEYYTLIEIFGQQWDIVAGSISGTFTWITSHPVV